MSHLGSQISALVDGQLSPPAAERVLAHAAACCACAEELAAARAARRTLASASDVPVDPGLTARLLALGAAGCEPGAVAPVAAAPTRGRLPDGSLPMPGSRRAQLPAGSTGCLRGDVASRTRGRVLATAAAGVGAAAVVLVALGVQPSVAPTAHPAHALTLLSRAAGDAGAGTTSSGPSSGTASSGSASSRSGASGTSGPGTAVARATTGRGTPTALTVTTLDASAGAGPADVPVIEWLGERGWSAPTALPAGYAVSAVREDVDGEGGVEVDLAGPEGTIVVTEQHGRLDPAAVDDAPTTTVGGREVRLLSSGPWHVVWQSGSTVVSVVAQTRTASAEALVVAYPHERYDDRVVARLARGWDVVAGSWGP